MFGSPGADTRRAAARLPSVAKNPDGIDALGVHGGPMALIGRWSRPPEPRARLLSVVSRPARQGRPSRLFPEGKELQRRSARIGRDHRLDVMCAVALVLRAVRAIDRVAGLGVVFLDEADALDHTARADRALSALLRRAEPPALTAAEGADVESVVDTNDPDGDRAPAGGEVELVGCTEPLELGAVMDAAEDVNPNLWRRYFTLSLQRLRPEGAPLEPLPVPALPPEHMEDLLVGQWKSRG